MYPCGLCDYQATTKSDLSRHNKTVHHSGQIMKLNCDFCDFQTVYKSELSKHRKLLHCGNAEVFKCDVCSFKTQYKNNLKNHENKHFFKTYIKGVSKKHLMVDKWQ